MLAAMASILVGNQNQNQNRYDMILNDDENVPLS